jgi:mandelate racemase
LQIGENFYGPRDLYIALRMKACDFVMPDFMRIGGVTGWLRAVPIAAAAGIPVSTHLYPEVAAHMMRVTETAHWLEWQDWVNPLIKEPFEIRNGHLQIPDRPGIGIEWDEASIREHMLD